MSTFPPPTTTAATPRPQVTPSNPVVQVGALALVSLAAALSFARVFDGGAFVGPIVLAALVPHAVGLVGRLRRWSPPNTLAAGIAASVLVGLWSAVGHATTYGVPTPAAFSRIDHLLDRGWSVFRTGIAPVPARPGVVLLGVVVVAAMALTADAIARRPDVVLAPLGPSLVVFVLTGTLGADDLRVTTTLAYVGAAIVATALANAARLESRRTWFTGHRLASDATILRNALAIGAGALVLGLVLTPLIPGSGSAPLLHYRNRSGAGTQGTEFSDYVGVSPLVDLRARLLQRPNVELFRVSANRPLGWRLVALDHFDGTTWSLTSSARDATTVLRRARGARTIKQRYTITSLADRWLPAAYRPIAINLASVRAIPESTTLVSPNQVTGLDYEVESVIETEPGDLAVAHTAEALPPTMRKYLQTPSFFMTPRVRAVMQQTGGHATPWEDAIALREYFTTGDFVYDTRTDLGDGPAAIDQFLELRRGFCQQFAAAFAGIARAQGIPSRVVVGFTPGVFDARQGEYVVRGRDAHAWVELWFAGLGWRTFDPTPAGPLPGMADTRVTEGRTETSATTVTTTPTSTTPPTTTADGRSNSSTAPIRDPDNRISTASPTATTGPSGRTIASIALGAAILGAALVWWFRRRTRDRRVRRRRRHAPEPAHRIAGAWADTVAVCGRAGLPTSTAFTPREQRAAFEANGLPADAVPPLRELVDLYERSVYAPDVTADDTSDEAWAAADKVRELVNAK